MALHQQLPLCFNLIKIAWSHITRQEAWESNSATALDSLGLSLPYMEDGEKGTITSDEKALELFFCSEKRQLTRSGKQDWGRCRNSGPLENNRLGLELGQALGLCSGDSGSHFSFEESFLIQRSLSNSDPASQTSYLSLPVSKQPSLTQKANFLAQTAGGPWPANICRDIPWATDSMSSHIWQVTTAPCSLRVTGS